MYFTLHGMYCVIILRSSCTSQGWRVVLLLLLLYIRCLFGYIMSTLCTLSCESHYDIMKGILSSIAASLIAKILLIMYIMSFYYYSHIIKILLHSTHIIYQRDVIIIQLIIFPNNLVLFKYIWWVLVWEFNINIWAYNFNKRYCFT